LKRCVFAGVNPSLVRRLVTWACATHEKKRHIAKQLESNETGMSHFHLRDDNRRSLYLFCGEYSEYPTLFKQRESLLFQFGANLVGGKKLCRGKRRDEWVGGRHHSWQQWGSGGKGLAEICQGPQQGIACVSINKKMQCWKSNKTKKKEASQSAEVQTIQF
jgi:hypothetical protein